MLNMITKLTTNPFGRGFERFSITRLAVVCTDSSSILQYREIIETEKTRYDWNLFGENCLFDQEYVYLLDDAPIPTSAQTKAGRICSVVYAIDGYTGLYHTHIGDAITLDAAQSVVKAFSFISGQYGRCWQISTQHLTAGAFSLLQELFYDKNPDNALLEVFPLNDGQSLGIQFLQHDSFQRPNDLINEFIKYKERLVLLFGADAPDCLVNVLSLAYIAGTTVLIFGETSPILEGLPFGSAI